MSQEATPEATTPDRRRTRVVIVLSSLLTLLVMAGVIALGLRAREGAAGDTRRPPGAWGDPYRNVPWDVEGCEPDRARPARFTVDLPPEGLDFGPVKQGVVLERLVTFRSDGKGTLCIRDVDAPCGCVKVALEGGARVFEPGTSGQIRVQLDTDGFEGSIDKVVSVYTNELDRPRITFRVKASITVGLIATPRHLTFPRALVGQPSTATVRLRSTKEDDDWDVIGVEGRVERDGEKIPYTFETVPMKDTRYRMLDVRVTHPGRDAVGPFQDAIVIRTTHPDRPEVSVRAHLRVVEPILAYPPDLAFGYLPAPTRKLRVRLLPGTDAVSFEVLGVRFAWIEGDEGDARDVENFRAVHERGSDGVWYVDVVYEGEPRQPGRLAARLIVTTDHPDQPEVRVPITARAR